VVSATNRAAYRLLMTKKTCKQQTAISLCPHTALSFSVNFIFLLEIKNLVLYFRFANLDIRINQENGWKTGQRNPPA
jgi:hypothetical protein